MIEKEVLWNQTLKFRNQLQQKCLKNKHSYSDEIKILIPEGVMIETVIGGREYGNINQSMVYPGDDLFLRINSHVKEVEYNYEKYGDKIIKDLK